MPRRLLALLLAAALLTAAPAKPAHALFGEELAVVATWLYNTLINGEAKLSAVLLAIETQLPIVEDEVQMWTDTHISMARSAAHQQYMQHQEYWFSMQQLMPDVQQASCQAATSLADTVQVRQPPVIESLLRGDFAKLENLGSFTSGGPDLDDIDATINTDAHRACSYGDENNVSDATDAGCERQTLAQLKANPRKNADLNATNLLTVQSYGADKDYFAAMDYSLNVIGNQPLRYAQNAALLENQNNWRQFLVSLSGKAARSVVADTYQQYVGRKLPLDYSFILADPIFKRAFTDAEQQTQQPTTVAKRTVKDIDASARKYLMDPSSGAPYTEVTAAEPVAGQIPTGAQNTLIKGQMVSREQADIAMFIYRSMAGSTQAGMSGTPNQLFTLLMHSRAANLQLLFRQYETLEKQLLIEAVSLAHSVHGSPNYGDPGAVSPQ